MKYTSKFLLVLLMLFCQGLIFAQTDQAFSSINPGNQEAQQERTNGVSCFIDVVPFNKSQYIMVSVKLNSTDIQFTNVTKTPFWKRFKYFVATNFKTTNTFCGPIELKDNTGRKLALITPQLGFADGYPDFININTAQRFLMSKHKQGVYNGPPLPEPLRRQESQLCAFYLEDYFKLDKSGEYNLTVWPKIYKRSSPTNDICCRLDLSPITIPIKWSGRHDGNN
jgi:hypothetical protein